MARDAANKNAMATNSHHPEEGHEKEEEVNNTRENDTNPESTGSTADLDNVPDPDDWDPNPEAAEIAWDEDDSDDQYTGSTVKEEIEGTDDYGGSRFATRDSTCVSVGNGPKRWVH